MVLVSHLKKNLDLVCLCCAWCPPEPIAGRNEWDCVLVIIGLIDWLLSLCLSDMKLSAIAADRRPIGGFLNCWFARGDCSYIENDPDDTLVLNLERAEFGGIISIYCGTLPSVWTLMISYDLLDAVSANLLFWVK